LEKKNCEPWRQKKKPSQYHIKKVNPGGGLEPGTVARGGLESITRTKKEKHGEKITKGEEFGGGRMVRKP